MNSKEQLANEIKVIEDADSKNGLTEYGKGQLKALKYAMELFDLYVVGKSLPTNKELTLISEQVIKDECKEFNKLGKLNIKLGILHYHKYLQQRDMKQAMFSNVL